MSKEAEELMAMDPYGETGQEPSEPRTKEAVATPETPLKTRRAPMRRPVAKAMAPELFFDRDESWLKFNWRVLEEAQDEGNPLLERVKFLAITASNLDEFVEIRVAGTMQRIEDGVPLRAEDEGSLTPEQRLEKVSGLIAEFVQAQYACWNQQLLPSLEKHHVRVLRWKKLSAAQKKDAESFYEREVDPLLTPVTIDPSHPFPRVLNKALCLALLLRHKRHKSAESGGKKHKAAKVLGVVTVPRSLPRLVCLKAKEGRADFIFLAELIEAQVEKMYRGYEVLGKAAFRVTRNSNLYMQEEESRSVLESVREELHNRRKGDAVRLEIEEAAPEEIVERLRGNFELEPWQVVSDQWAGKPFALDEYVYGDQAAGVEVSGVQRPELQAARRRGRSVRGAAGAGCAAASSVRQLPDGRGVCGGGGAG